jgi:hypothetical protein
LTGYDATPTASRSTALYLRYTRRVQRICLLLILLLLCGIGYEGVQDLRQQRRQYRLLCHRVEAAVAPGEPVLVQDLIAAIALRSMGSPALKEQLSYVRRNQRPPPLRSRRETILVATSDASLLRVLRAKGYSLTEAEWEQNTQRKAQRYVGNLQIFFVVAPNALKR